MSLQSDLEGVAFVLEMAAQSLRKIAQTATGNGMPVGVDAVINTVADGVAKTVTVPAMKPRCQEYKERTGLDCKLQLGHQFECSPVDPVTGIGSCVARRKGIWCTQPGGHDIGDDATEHTFPDE